MGKRGIGEMTLIHQNIQNCKNLIESEKSIITFDRGFAALELICRLINMNTYFVIRLKKNSYKKERKNIKTEDSPISIPLTENRLKIFKDSELKEQFQNVDELNLRIVNIELEKENKYKDLDVLEDVDGIKKFMRRLKRKGEKRRAIVLQAAEKFEVPTTMLRKIYNELK